MPRPSKTKAREDFVQAFAGILSQLDLRPIAQALADWRQAAKALKEEVQTVHDEASAYVDERSDTWQESDKGKVFTIWVTELEELADLDPVICQVRYSMQTWRVTQAKPCRSFLRCLSERSEPVKSQMHQVALRYTKQELLTIFAVATKEDVDLGGHYNCQGGAIHVWSHPWNTAAARYDSSPLGALYVNWMAECIYRIETHEGFDLPDLLHELAMLELKALGETRHGVERF